ncbi:MAG: hypothetical protein ACRBBP_06660 [Bdellovibrionales bacterium]
MEKKNILIALMLVSSLALSTGCKNESKSFIGDATVAPESINPNEEIVVLTDFEEAVQAKASSTEALNNLSDVKAEREEAVKERGEYEAALDGETSAIITSAIVASIANMDQKISGLDAQVDLSERLVVAKRQILNTILERLTENEKAEIGEADAEYQMAYNESEERRVRMEMTYEAQVEAVKNQTDLIEKLDISIKVLSGELEDLEATGQADSNRAVNLRSDIAKLHEQMTASAKQRTLLVAIRDSLAEDIRSL